MSNSLCLEYYYAFVFQILKVTYYENIYIISYIKTDLFMEEQIY